MDALRRQLTLFLPSEQSQEIEAFRKAYNPIQFQLIAAHITLCREDELTQWNVISQSLSNLEAGNLTVYLQQPTRFADAKGLSMEPAGSYTDFQHLRKHILEDTILEPRDHKPHITLIHPRNGRCTEAIWHMTQQLHFPPSFTFSQISLIEQKNGGKWETLEVFDLASPSS
ncbi:MAG: 2'-5' RNA ligase family protein [Bacteroidota bacterium]